MVHEIMLALHILAMTAYSRSGHLRIYRRESYLDKLLCHRAHIKAHPTVFD